MHKISLYVCVIVSIIAILYVRKRKECTIFGIIDPDLSHIAFIRNMFTYISVNIANWGH